MVKRVYERFDSFLIHERLSALAARHSFRLRASGMEVLAEQLVNELPERWDTRAKFWIVWPDPEQLDRTTAWVIRIVDDRKREPVHPAQVDAADFLAEWPCEPVRGGCARILGERSDRLCDTELPSDELLEFAVDLVVRSYSEARDP